MEQFANNAQTTLNGSINNSVTSVVVADASTFPTSGNFRIIVDSEIMLVTAVSSNTFTVSRGQEGTAAASHANAADTALILTKGSMAAFRSDSIFYDTFANRPTVGAAGRIHVVSDDVTLAIDDGATWRPFGPVHKFTPPVNGDFAWVNQGGASVSTSQDGILLSAPTNSGDSHRIRKKAAPSTPYVITAFFQYNVFPQNYVAVGLLFRESSSGKEHTFGLSWSGNLAISSTKWNSTTSFSGEYLFVTNMPNSFLRGTGWIRIADDGTNRKCYVSNDGKNWLLFHSVSRTDWITANEVGFYINVNNTTYSATSNLMSWKET